MQLLIPVWALSTGSVDDIGCFDICRHSDDQVRMPAIWGLWGQKQVSQAWISNCIPHNAVGCNYLSLSGHSALGLLMTLGALTSVDTVMIRFGSRTYEAFWCQKQVSQAWISNCIPHNAVGCNYLSLSGHSALGLLMTLGALTSVDTVMIRFGSRTYEAFWCQKQVSQAWISNCIPHNAVGCNYLSLSEHSALGLLMTLGAETSADTVMIRFGSRIYEDFGVISRYLRHG